VSGSVLPTLLHYQFTQQLARCRKWPWWGWLAWPLNAIALFLACSHDEFHGFFTTAAAFSALGGTRLWHRVRKNGGVERDPWTWGWKLPFLPFPFSFFTAAAFLALGGSNLDLECEQRRRRSASSVTRELTGESSLSSLSRSLSSRLLRSRRSGVRDLDLECERRRRHSVSSVTRQLDGESSLSSLSRSLSSRLLRSRRSGERDLDRECERRRRCLKKQSKRTAASTLGVETRERDGESSPISCLLSRWRSQLLSPPLLRSRRSGELDLDRECERRRRRLKKQTFHRLASYAEVLQYNGLLSKYELKGVLISRSRNRFLPSSNLNRPFEGLSIFTGDIFNSVTEIQTVLKCTSTTNKSL